MTGLGKAALIVDDDESVLRNFSRLLEEDGYEVYSAGTGKDAIDLVGKHNFDVILVDFRLPDIDGDELLDKINDKVTNAVKVMITGFPTITLENKVNDLGIDAYVVKPIKPLELLSLIQEKLKEKKS